jgi:oligoendopeptidase F
VDRPGARLKTYKHYLDDIQRRQPHTLSDAEERLLASSGVALSAASSTYNILANADFPYPSVTLSDGKTVKLDSSSYSLYRSVPNREDRKKVMEAFFTELGKFKGTYGTTLNGRCRPTNSSRRRGSTKSRSTRRSTARTSRSWSTSASSRA